MGSSPDKVKAPKADYAKDINKFVSAYGGALPQVLGFEKNSVQSSKGLTLGIFPAF